MLSMMAILLASCANEDIAQDKKKENGTEAPKGGVVFVTNDTKISAKRRFIDEDEFADAKTRTNIKHTPGQGAEAYWTSDDFIWVKKQDGTWAKSTAITLHDGGASAEFTLPGSKSDYADGCEVRYTGTKAYYSGTLSASSVFIPYQQSRTVANDFSKAGEWGDCGSGKAHNTGNPTKFNFTLEHKSAYLCFLPRCTNAALASNIQLKGIKITATNNMSGGFIGDQCGFDGDNVSSSGGSPFGQNYIDVTLPGFPLSTTENQAANATYLVVPPDTYDFKIEYTIKDPTTNVETVITDIRTGITLEKGNIYDVTADLALHAPKFYMWNAKRDYWYGHMKADGTPDDPLNNYPKSNTDQRWYDESFPGNGLPYTAQSELFKKLPNVNELFWYVFKGGAYYDLKTCINLKGDHLQNTGTLWLKKKEAILTYLKNVEHYPATLTWDDLKEAYWATPTATHIDYRTSQYGVFGSIGGQVFCKEMIGYMISPPNEEDYFALPFQGYYTDGQWLSSNYSGFWSSSAYTWNGNDKAFYLYSDGPYIYIIWDKRTVGNMAIPFE